MHLGSGLETASGVLHEIDMIARGEDVTAIVEMKNRRGVPPGKNDVIVFFAKVLDYLTANPGLLSKDREISLAFVSSGSFEPRALEACLGLGIHPIGGSLRPLPILIQSAIIMDKQVRDNDCLVLPEQTEERLDDFCASLNSLSVALRDTWVDSRCGQVSEDKITVRAIGTLSIPGLAQQILQLNSDCTDLLSEIRIATKG